MTIIGEEYFSTAATAPTKISAPSCFGLSRRIFMPLFIPGPTISSFDKLIYEEKKETINNALKILNERELDIIGRRFGLNENQPKTQREIAADLKISRSYVSRIEKRALTKLYLEIQKGNKPN